MYKLNDLEVQEMMIQIINETLNDGFDLTSVIERFDDKDNPEIKSGFYMTVNGTKFQINIKRVD